MNLDQISSISEDNLDKWEDSLGSDDSWSDAVSQDFKDAFDAIDLIQEYVHSGWQSPKFYKDNIKRIKQDEKNGHDYLYTCDHENSAFHPVDHVYTINDFKDYDGNDF